MNILFLLSVREGRLFNMEKTIEELIYEETDQRLKIMASPNYQFPKKADKNDVVGIVAGIVISTVLIVLCMTGVIA